MELKINISESLYKKIQKDDPINPISFDQFRALLYAVRNGIPADEALDNVKSVSSKEIKDKADEPISKEKTDEHKEICRLMEAYLGRSLEAHEIQILSLYKTVEYDKETLAGLSGMDRILMKMFIRSLLS